MKTYLYHSLLLILALFGLAVPSHGQKSGNDPLWQLSTTDLQGTYVGAPMANGGIGILPWREPFSVRHVILNHVFDADRERGVSRVLKGINPFLLSMEADGRQVDAADISHWQQTIDLKRALHRTEFRLDGRAEVSYELCALRNMPHAGLIRVRIKALKPVDLRFASRMEIPEGYTDTTRLCRDTEADGISVRMLHSYATSTWRGVEVAASSTFLFGEERKEVHTDLDEAAGEMSFGLRLDKGETLEFALMGSVCTSRDFLDPWNEAEREAIYAHHEGCAALLDAHTRLWDDLWQSDICIEGDDEAQRAVRFALFNLYSSCRAGSRLSIPPMGLSSQDYNGHIFWDTELWMYPPMLLLNEDIARSMIDYRIDRLPAARRKAMAYGYRGAMFPWESDDAGEEATPTTALTGPFEHHVTADIAIACWNYYCVTQDRQWLLREGYPLLREVADFWASRAVRNEDGTFSIRNVVGANEYKHGAVDNAFTNAAARLALSYACRAAELCGDTPDARWKEVSEGLRIHRFADGVTREHASYDGEMIKQADVNLLGYPLNLITDSETLRKDLAYHAGRIDPQHGPAMSYSVFCVQYARMGDAGKAYEMFLRSYRPNLRPPFGVLAETPTSNNPYFMTGAGGLLQAVINGFCGLQITEQGIVQLPSALPPHWKRVTVTGVGPEKRVYENVRR